MYFYARHDAEGTITAIGYHTHDADFEAVIAAGGCREIADKDYHRLQRSAVPHKFAADGSLEELPATREPDETRMPQQTFLSLEVVEMKALRREIAKLADLPAQLRVAFREFIEDMRSTFAK